MHSSHAGSRANRATLYQVLQDAHGLFFSQDHFTKWLWLYLYKCLSAFWAAISLLPLSILPKLFSWQIAGLAVHLVSSLEQHKNIIHSKHCQEKSSLSNKKTLFPPKIDIPFWEFEGSYVDGLGGPYDDGDSEMTVGIGLICESGDCVILSSDIRSHNRGIVTPHDWTGKQYPFPPFDLVACIAGDTSSTHAIVSEFSGWLAGLIRFKQENRDFKIQFEHVRNALERSRKKEMRRLQVCALSSSTGLDINDWMAGTLSDGRKISNYLMLQGLRAIQEVGKGMWKKAQIIIGGFLRGKPVLIRGVGNRAAEDGPTPAFFVIGGTGAHYAQELFVRRSQSSEMGIAISLFHAYEAMQVAKKNDNTVGKMDDFTIIRRRSLSRGRVGISRFKWDHPTLRRWAKIYRKRTTKSLDSESINDMIVGGLDASTHPNSEWLGPKQMAEEL